MSSSAVLSDNTLQQADDRQSALLKNINNLQTMESDLYTQLEAASVNDTDSANQDAIVKKINELSTMRMTMFQELDGMYRSMQGRVAQSRIDLVDQLTVTGVMEKELNNAKKNLNLVQANKNNKMRLVEINTYYASKYKAQADLMKMVIMICIPLLILAIVAKKGLIPQNISKALIGVVIVVGGFMIIKQAINLSSRNNMNFDEFNWAWNADANDPTVYDYNKEQLEGTSDDLEDDANSFAANLGIGCVGSNCCADGTTYDEDKGQCIEGFANGRPAVSYVEVEGGVCPFKAGKNVVKPFSDTQNNYVRV
jgi:hypothetical protein